jgi:DNA-binding response OmpR family regulator
MTSTGKNSQIRSKLRRAVSSRKNGNEAWTLLQRADCPKLILLDWVLPDIDGIELCRRIRQSSSVNSYSYIILLTGKDAPNDVLEAMEAGADDYLVKHLSPLSLEGESSILYGFRRHCCRAAFRNRSRFRIP